MVPNFSTGSYIPQEIKLPCGWWKNLVGSRCSPPFFISFSTKKNVIIACMTRKSQDLVWGYHLSVEACQKNFKTFGYRHNIHASQKYKSHSTELCSNICVPHIYIVNDKLHKGIYFSQHLHTTIKLTKLDLHFSGIPRIIYVLNKI